MSSAVEVAAGKAKTSCDAKSGCDCRRGKSASYLAALTLVAWGIQAPMLLFAVPKFAERLRDFGVQLPEISTLVINWSEWMQVPVGGTVITGTMVFGVGVMLLTLIAFAIAKVGGGFGKALVVLLALLGGAIACGQAAAVIVPTLAAQRAVDNSAP